MNTTKTRTQITTHGLFAGLAAICLTVSTTSIRAAEDTGYAPAAQRVEFGDLNLANRQGVTHLYGRIVAAAQEVCNSKDRSLEVVAHDRICIRQSIARAVKAINRPELTALHAAQIGQSQPLVAKVTRP